MSDKTPRNTYKAACVAALYELDRLGYLEGRTLQQIADAIDMGHRSTALRYMRDVDELKQLVPEIIEKLNKGFPEKQESNEQSDQTTA